MALKFSNNATTVLAQNLLAENLTVQGVSLTSFPTLGVGDYTYATLAKLDSPTDMEIVKVTGISGSTATVERGQQGTTALDFVAGSLFELRLTAGSLDDLAGNITTVATTLFGLGPVIAANTEKVTYTDLLPLDNTWTGANAFTAGLKSEGAGANSFRAGTNAGATSQGIESIAIGFNSGRFGQITSAISMGRYSGNTDQEVNAVAIGSASGRLGQKSGAIGIGTQTGEHGQGGNSVSIGNSAGQYNQGDAAISIGNSAGRGTNATGDFQGIQALAIGPQAGRNFQGAGSIALGALAGVTNQGANGIIVSSKQTTALNDTTDGHIHIASTLASLDYDTVNAKWTATDTTGAFDLRSIDLLPLDNTWTGANAFTAGLKSEGAGANSFRAGNNTAGTNQGASAVAIGQNTGYTDQGANSVAIGTNAAANTQLAASIAIGASAGQFSQKAKAIAHGLNAGRYTQGESGIALGYNAGSYFQNDDAIAIGKRAGEGTAAVAADGQGASAVAIGAFAGQINQGANGIIINSTGAALDDTAAGHIHIASNSSAIDYTPDGGWRTGGQAMVVADIVAASSDFADFQSKVALLQVKGSNAFVSVWATTGAFETITIPTQNDTFNAVVDWGDGTVETITTYNGFSHVYEYIGDHTISITGVFPNIYLYLAADRLKIKKVTNLGAVGWTTFQNSFFGCTSLTEFTVGSTDTSAVTTFRSMFYGCSGLTSLNVSNLDTSLANSTTFMFWGCTGLTSVDVSSWDTALVDNMASMFQNCSGLTSLDVSSFVTTSVTNMSQMFIGCNGLTSMVGVEDWDITGLNSTNDLTNFLTNGSMTTAQYDALLVKWEAQSESVAGMTPSFGASKYTNGGTAAAARAAMLTAGRYSAINDGGIATSAFVSVWATTAEDETITIPTNGGTFYAIVDWGDNSAVQLVTTGSGFSHPYDDIGEYTITITGVFSSIFLNNGPERLKLKKVLNLGNVAWGFGSGSTGFLKGFYGCTNLIEFTVGSTDTSNIANMSQMFRECSGLTSLDFSYFDTSSVINMGEMFRSCSGLTSLDVSYFDTSIVTDMGIMFFLCSGLTSIDVSSFDTGKVTNMGYMFYGCNGLTSIVGVEDFVITDLNGVNDLNFFLIGGRMTTAQYDALLVKWEAQSEFAGMSPAFGASTYTLGSAAATARAAMLTTGRYNAISDGV